MLFIIRIFGNYCGMHRSLLQVSIFFHSFQFFLLRINEEDEAFFASCSQVSVRYDLLFGRFYSQQDELLIRCWDFLTSI